MALNKYEQTTARKKAAIIEAAQALFGERGVSAVSMKEIAAKAGVSQASIYNYFGAKEAVVAKCATKVIEDTVTRALEILKLEIPYPEKINRALLLCSEGTRGAICECFTEKALQDKALARLLAESIRQGNAKIYREFIELGKKEKGLNAQIPTEVYLKYIEAIGTIGESEAENIEHIYRLFLYGLLGS